MAGAVESLPSLPIGADNGQFEDPHAGEPPLTAEDTPRQEAIAGKVTPETQRKLDFSPSSFSGRGGRDGLEGGCSRIVPVRCGGSTAPDPRAFGRPRLPVRSGHRRDDDVVDVSLQRYLGVRVDTVQVSTLGPGDVGLDLFVAPDARVGSLTLKSPVGCHDFTPFREASGCDIRGLLGMDFLKDWIVAFDFDDARLDFLAPGTARDPAWGECIPFVYGDAGAMCVMVKVGVDIRALFLIDTAHRRMGNLKELLFSRLVALHEIRLTGDTIALTLSGEISSREGRLSQLSLGSFQHQNLRFASGKRNVLGLQYFRSFRLTIDFPNGRLFLAKGRQFAGRDPGPMCGITVLFRAGQIEIKSTDEKGPAYAAGLRPKDVIIELCGKPVSHGSRPKSIVCSRRKARPFK